MDGISSSRDSAEATPPISGKADTFIGITPAAPVVPISYSLMHEARIWSENSRPWLLYTAIVILAVTSIYLIGAVFALYSLSRPATTVSEILEDMLRYDGKKVKVKGVIVDYSSTQWIIADSMDSYVNAMLKPGSLGTTSGIFVSPKIATFDVRDHAYLEGTYDAAMNTLFVKEAY